MNDITILDIIKIFWSKKSFFIRNSVIFLLLGVVIALTTPVEWESRTDLIPESTSSSSLGSLGGIASLAGVDLSADGQEGISTEVYPLIINSTPFLYEALYRKYYIAQIGDSIRLSTYLNEHLEVSLLKRITGSLKSIFNIFGSNSDSVGKLDYINLEINDLDVLHLTRHESELMDILKSRINVSVSERNGTVRLTSKIQDPNLSAELTAFSKTYLTKYLIDYETQKQRNKLNFISEQLEAKRHAYLNSQKALAEFSDRNINITTNRAQIELDNLTAERDLAFNVYSSLSQQFEETKLKLEENTPVFKVLEPITVPTKRESPNRKMIVISFVFLSIILSGVFIYLKNFVIPNTQKAVK